MIKQRTVVGVERKGTKKWATFMCFKRILTVDSLIKIGVNKND